MDSFWGSWQNLVFVSIILGTMVHFQDSEYHSVQASWKNLSDHAWSAWKALLDIEFLFHSFKFLSVQFSSATQSCPTLCDPMDCSMRGLPRSPSPTPGVYSNSCPSSQWCHPAISSSVVPFSSRPQSLPASGSFPMSQFFTSGGQGVGVSASASVLPMNIQNWFPLDRVVESPCSPRDSQESFPTPQFKSIKSSALSFLYSPTLMFVHDYWENYSFD